MNILFVMTDHTCARALTPGTPCRTPSLDRLASRGVRLGRCYTPNAICSPARASLMTGTYPSTHGMWDCAHTQRPEWVDVPPGRLPYFSQHLAEAGYYNGYFGKWHVEQSGRLEQFGWHEYDTSRSLAAYSLTQGSEVVVRNPGYRDYLLAATGDDAATPSHPAFDAGAQFLRDHARGKHGDGPFCCFISALEPHDPYIAPQRFLDLYDVDSVPLSPTLRDEPHGKPEVIRRMRTVWEGMSDDDWRRVTAAYWAVISFLDDQFGRLMAVLEETGQLDETLVIFTSDHGDMMGGHGLLTKGVATAYEEVYNIPLIMAGPGITGGRNESEALVNLVDLAPTLLDLCSARPLDGAQGRSFRALLTDEADAAQWQETYGEFFGQRFVYTQRIVWHGDWKYIFSPGGVDELYNLVEDPHERVNLAENPSQREVVVDMATRMWRKMKEIGDDSLFNSHYATLRTAPVGPYAAD